MSENAAARCQSLVTNTAGTLAWESDARLHCALAAFGTDDAKGVQAAISEAAEQLWTSENIESAPPRVQSWAKKLGLRSGQMLFTSDPTAAVMLYAAWWPWGNGQRISVRVGVDGAQASELASWFGL